MKDEVYVSPWAFKKKFTEMELAIMEGGHSIEEPKEDKEPREEKMSFLKSLIKNDLKSVN